MTTVPNLDHYRSFLVKIVYGFVRLPRPLRLFIGLAILATPLLLAYHYSLLPDLWARGAWRTLLVHPIMIIYVIGVIPILGRTDQQVIMALRPVVDVSDEEYFGTVDRSARPKEWVELAALIIGLGFGYLVGQPDTWQEAFWLRIYTLCKSMLMYGLLAWVISLALLEGRYTDALLAKPLRIDIFDISPFEPIGRQSLMLALTFVVGATLSQLFAPTWDDLFNWMNLLLYGLFILVTILVFFLNMRTPHHVLVVAKRNEIRTVQRMMERAYRTLATMNETDSQREKRHTAATELSAWIDLERRIKLTRTWPYNTEMLRTLAVSVLLPAAIGLVRVLFVLRQN